MICEGNWSSTCPIERLSRSTKCCRHITLERLAKLMELNNITIFEFLC